MEELFECEYWADTSALLKAGAKLPGASREASSIYRSGRRLPDFVCGFKDGSLGVFEAKGTTGTQGGLTGALSEGKKQTQGIGAQDPITRRVVVGAALGGYKARVILLDPDEPGSGRGHRTPDSGHRTNLNIKLVAEAARAMRAPSPVIPAPEPESRGAVPTGITETIFRGPTAQIQLTREEYREGKGHGWLRFET